MNKLTKFMPAITSVVLGVFVGYILMWYLDKVEGNFSLLLFLASCVTGVYWLLERFIFLPERAKAAGLIDQAVLAQEAKLAAQGISKTEVHTQELQDSKQAVLQQPWWLDWTAGLFPVIVIVFLLRSFLFEPFKIPTGSMIPTLLVNDLILVNKFTYGVRLPVINKKIISVNDPQRGDVMVFRYPPKPTVDYIKRIVGVPGDEISYLNKQLMVNGKPITKTAVPDFLHEDTLTYDKQFEEAIPNQSGNDKKVKILNNPFRPARVAEIEEFAAATSGCQYSAEGVVCKVPVGHYFMMGDNRDNSLDSRYWGFVPEENIVGKAVAVWMHLDINLRKFSFSFKPSRIGGID